MAVRLTSCHMPVSGRRMQRFLQFRLGCHGLPIATGRLLALLMLTGLRGCAYLEMLVLLGMRGT